jgi:hypothetical protein
VLGKTGALFTVWRRCCWCPRILRVQVSALRPIYTAAAHGSASQRFGQKAHTPRSCAVLLCSGSGFNTLPGWSPARPMEDLTIPAAEFQGRERKGRLHARQTRLLSQKGSSTRTMGEPVIADARHHSRGGPSGHICHEPGPTWRQRSSLPAAGTSWAWASCCPAAAVGTRPIIGWRRRVPMCGA